MEINTAYFVVYSIHNNLHMPTTHGAKKMKNSSMWGLIFNQFQPLRVYQFVPSNCNCPLANTQQG